MSNDLRPGDTRHERGLHQEIRGDDAPWLNAPTGNWRGKGIEAMISSSLSSSSLSLQPPGPDCAGMLSLPIVYSLALISSNAVMMPAIIIALRRGHTPEACLMASVMVASLVFHACQTHIVCVGDFRSLQLADLITSWGLVVWACMWLVGWRLSTRASILFFVDQVLLAYLSVFVDEPWRPFAALFAATAVILACRLRRQKYHVDAPFTNGLEMHMNGDDVDEETHSMGIETLPSTSSSEGKPGKLVVVDGFVLLILVILVVYLAATESSARDVNEASVFSRWYDGGSYWWRHTLWHVGVMVGMLFVVVSRDSPHHGDVGMCIGVTQEMTNVVGPHLETFLRGHMLPSPTQTRRRRQRGSSLPPSRSSFSRGQQRRPSEEKEEDAHRRKESHRANLENGISSSFVAMRPQQQHANRDRVDRSRHSRHLSEETTERSESPVKTREFSREGRLSPAIPLSSTTQVPDGQQRSASHVIHLPVGIPISVPPASRATHVYPSRQPENGGRPLTTLSTMSPARQAFITAGLVSRLSSDFRDCVDVPSFSTATPGTTTTQSSLPDKV